MVRDSFLPSTKLLRQYFACIPTSVGIDGQLFCVKSARKFTPICTQLTFEKPIRREDWCFAPTRVHQYGAKVLNLHPLLEDHWATCTVCAYIYTVFCCLVGNYYLLSAPSCSKITGVRRGDQMSVPHGGAPVWRNLKWITNFKLLWVRMMSRTVSVLRLAFASGIFGKLKNPSKVQTQNPDAISCAG